jgi:3-oxoacyl-(acyl-carrier-protein) synthase
MDGVLGGVPAFGPVSRFDVSRRRTAVGALLPGDPVLFDELVAAVDLAATEAGLTAAGRAGTPLLLALHGDPGAARHRGDTAGTFVARVAEKCGLRNGSRAYTSACVAASTAVADAASMVSHRDVPRVVVAAGYLVEPDQFALFDAGRALATDGAVRPFSAGRKGLLLGDGVAAIVVEPAGAHTAAPLAELAGWGRAGDAYHVCQPRPDGAGLARAITAALSRAGVVPAAVGYVNAHGSGTAHSDAAEANALRLALGPAGGQVPVSSTKSLHGQALEASALLELIVTVLALRHGRLPRNAGYLGPDEDCALNLILDETLPASPRYALSLNSAFGGANTALLVAAP